ncbi:hypothetical protein LEP1GSC083_4426 [Leptospira interrogans serovar Pyrogenes str. L0374]|uniref:Uncharacterized protein n=1 Tax=Leptospira interrogans serovar Pyrogenes str. L0374 TaxID=1049928 RepID=M6KBC9_LEPIR|nr:hypothetical protein LEP1GSC083_4426 [Leptospira interrogans serovar Pyrogenes str. L0374]
MPIQRLYLPVSHMDPEGSQFYIPAILNFRFLNSKVVLNPHILRSNLIFLLQWN